MLTKVVGNRVYDFSHSIGDPNDTLEPIALAVGDENELFAIIKGILELSPNVTRISLGDVPGDERIVSMIGGGYGEGPGQFTWPTGVALDSDRNVYVTDAWTDRVSVFTVEGDFIRSFGTSGDGDGQFRRPSGIAIDYNDNVLVVDALNDRIQRLTRDGSFISQWGSSGPGNGEFLSPWGITTDAEGCVYVADYKNHRIQKFDGDGGFVFALGSRGSGRLRVRSPVRRGSRSGRRHLRLRLGEQQGAGVRLRRDVHHHVHRGRARAVEVAERFRPRQSRRSQGAAARPLAGT